MGSTPNNITTTETPPLNVSNAQSNAQQNKDKHRTPQPMGSTPNNITTTETPPLNGQQPKPQGGLNSFYCIVADRKHSSTY